MTNKHVFVKFQITWSSVHLLKKGTGNKKVNINLAFKCEEKTKIKMQKFYIKPFILIMVKQSLTLQTVAKFYGYYRTSFLCP